MNVCAFAFTGLFVYSLHPCDCVFAQKNARITLTHVKLLIVWEHNPSISKIVNEIFGSMKKLQYLCYRYPENNLFTLNVN